MQRAPVGLLIFNGCLLNESFTEREDDLRMTWINRKLEKIAIFAEFVVFNMTIQELSNSTWNFLRTFPWPVGTGRY